MEYKFVMLLIDILLDILYRRDNFGHSIGYYFYNYFVYKLKINFRVRRLFFDLNTWMSHFCFDKNTQIFTVIIML